MATQIWLAETMCSVMDLVIWLLQHGKGVNGGDEAYRTVYNGGTWRHLLHSFLNKGGHYGDSKKTGSEDISLAGGDIIFRQMY